MAFTSTVQADAQICTDTIKVNLLLREASAGNGTLYSDPPAEDTIVANQQTNTVLKKLWVA